jgi:hypothetical protein
MGPLTIGRIVQYQLTAGDAEQINKRRGDYGKADKTVDTGFQAHVGNSAREGQVFPLLVTAVNGSGEGASVNGQVFLDGNDVFWATSRKEGSEAGTWAWPKGTAQAAKAKEVSDDQKAKLTPETTSSAE